MVTLLSGEDVVQIGGIVILWRNVIMAFTVAQLDDYIFNQGFSGLAACGNVCCCPVCNFKIMSYRQKQISQALRTCKERKYGVVFATLTLRHKKGEKLEIIMDDATAFNDLKEYLAEQQIGFREMYDGEEMLVQFCK